MQKQGYYAKVVCEGSVGKIDAEYLSQGVDIPAFLLLIARKFELSVIVLCTSRPYPAWDVLIDVWQDGYRLRTEEGVDIRYAFSAQEEMYAFILRVLEPEETGQG